MSVVAVMWSWWIGQLIGSCVHHGTCTGGIVAAHIDCDTVRALCVGPWRLTNWLLPACLARYVWF